MKKTAIGVDIGGTSIKLGVVNSRGKILFHQTFLTQVSGGRKKTLEILSRHIDSLLTQAKGERLKILGVGVGAPGPIDVEKGKVYFFPNIPGWKNTPLKALLEKRLNLPVYLDNDASAMALGEFHFGAGRGARSVIALTLGTGLGGGLVLGGKLFHGATFSAAEIGHLSINEKGLRCGCGSSGCIETYVGSGYFVRELQKRLKSGRKSILRSWLLASPRIQLTPLLAAKAAARGDKLCQGLWRETGEHLGTALASLVNILNPERIILGGGLAQSRELLFKPLLRTLKKKAFPIAVDSVRVVPAKLGVDAGLIGAAALVFSNQPSSKTKSY